MIHCYGTPHVIFDEGLHGRGREGGERGMEDTNRQSWEQKGSLVVGQACEAIFSPATGFKTTTTYDSSRFFTEETFISASHCAVGGDRDKSIKLEFP